MKRSELKVLDGRREATKNRRGRPGERSLTVVGRAVAYDVDVETVHTSLATLLIRRRRREPHGLSPRS